MKEYFEFTGKLKTFCAVLIGVGVLSLLIGVMAAEPGTHQSLVWTNILKNSVFFIGISFISLFVISAKILAYSGWHTVFKRLLEAMTMFLPVGILLMIVIIAGILTNAHHIYEWAVPGVADPSSENYDYIIAGKSGFLNVGMYIGFTIIILGLWTLFAWMMRRNSVQEDEQGGLSFFRSNKVWAAVFLPLGGFSSAAVIWLWVMSIDSHWYSTLFAWYVTASWLVSAVCILILLLLFLKSTGHFKFVTKEHLHDLGKYLFGFSIFWAYLWFSQYMLIWYANIGEETMYFQERMNDFPVLFYGNLLVNFALPFLILMAKDTKRQSGILAFVSIVVLLGHWVDFYQMVKPGVWKTVVGPEAGTFVLGWHFPGFVDLGMFIGFAGLFLWVVFSSLSKASLVPQNDPYLQESIHHHVVLEEEH